MENNPFDGGILEGHFDVRDEFAVQAQTELDEIAASLIDRFQGDDVDPTQTDVLGIPALGIFTDGDLRRSLDNRVDIHETSMKDVMSKEFKFASPEMLAVDAMKLLKQHKITHLLVTNKNHILLGVLNIHDLLQAGIVRP